jgi:hypothetical protein
VVRRKLPEKLGTNSWFLLHNNAPSHPLVLFEEFLAKNNVITLDHSTILVVWLQLIFTSFLHGKSGSFYATGTIKNAMEELKMLYKMSSRSVSNTFTFAGRII